MLQCFETDKAAARGNEGTSASVPEVKAFKKELCWKVMKALQLLLQAAIGAV